MSGLVGTSAMQWERVERIGARKLRIAGVLGFAGLTALAAQVSVALQPYGIPITMQTLPVMLCALTLGGRLGMVSMLVYVLLGLVGLPIFAHGAGGLSHVWGASGGYLLGFVVAQPIISAPSRSISLIPASAVPPVASRSSTSRTLSPGQRASSCSSMIASPYSSL